jgi:uncharacterized coiled-coil DUF342 family protein
MVKEVMEINSDYYLSASLWLFTTAISLAIVLFGLYMYFWQKKRIAAALSDSADVANLAAEKEMLQADVQQCRNWLDQNREELLQLDSERAQQETLREELAKLSTEVFQEEQKLDEVRNEAGSLQHVISTLSDDKDKIENKIAELEKQIPSLTNDIEKLNSELHSIEERKKQLNEEQKVFENKIQDSKNEYQVQRNANNDQLESLQKDQDEKVKQLENEYQTKEESLQDEFESLKNKLNEVEAEVNKAKRECDTQKEECQTLLNQKSALQEGVLRLEAEYQQREHLRNEIENLKSQITQQENKLSESFREEKRQIQELQEKIFEKKNDKEFLERQVLALQSQLDEIHPQNSESDDSYSDLFEVQPDCLSVDRKETYEIGKLSEEETLSRLIEYLDNQGYFFSDRVINAFHTSIKINEINPLTVLAGISGTGKSLLPIKYAEAFGMHKLLVSVQPRWDSPQDLFGFYNYLEKSYKATDLSRALIRMDEYNFQIEEYPQLKNQKRSDGMLLVLLDEMNLARTEYYFSEFLSKLEMRRLINDSNNKADRASAEFELEIGQGTESDSRLKLWVGSNVIFVGTMNEDESTQTLSDKVLDRANVLRFGKPPDHSNRSIANNNSDQLVSYLSYDQWKSWIQPNTKLETALWRSETDEWIKKLNNALEHVSRPFGYRVKDSINAYIVNYPGVERGNRYKTAMADQIEQKIIPKLRGLDLGSETTIEALEEIKTVIDTLEDTDLSEAFEKCSVEDRSSEGLFIWKGITREIQNG